MAEYIAGNIVTVSTLITTPAGTPIDPTTISLALLNPDGSTTTYPNPAHDSTGAFHVDLQPAAGHYTYRWVTTGTATAADEGEFDVSDAFTAGNIVSLADIKTHLNETSTVHDDELRSMAAAAVPVIEHITGPVIPTTVTEWHDAGAAIIVPRRLPLITVVSLTEYLGSTTYPLTAVASPDLGSSYSFMVDGDGIIRRLTAGGYMPFLGRTVQLVYRAGRSPVPANIRLAALELVRVNYQQTQQGGGGRQFGGANPDMPEPGTMMLGFFVPNRVRELLLPAERLPAIA